MASNNKIAGSDKKLTTNYNVSSVKNAIHILELLGNSEYEQSLSEIFSKLELTKSNAEKLLKTLEMFGYVENNKNTGNYNLSIKTFQLSCTYMNKINIMNIAVPMVIEFGRSIDESVLMYVMDGDSVICYPIYETKQPVQVITDINIVSPAFLSVGGQVLHAFNTHIPLEEMYFTNINVNQNLVDTLPEIFEQIRLNGYVVENKDGITSFAAPVFDSSKKPIIGVGVVAPEYRMNEQKYNQCLTKLIDITARVSAKFGYSEQPA